MRTFIAVRLPDEIKKKLDKKVFDLRKSDVQAKWVASANLHLTLKFLGDVEDEAVPAIIKILELVASAQDPFRVNLSGFGFFPLRGRPRVLFANTDQQERVKMLAAAVDDKLSDLGFVKEGRIHSHITLARLKGPKNLYQLQERIAATALKESFMVASLVLYKSSLSSAGASYEVLHEAHFNR